MRDNDLNQSQMARLLDISPQLLGQYLQGRQTPKANFLIAFKKAFNVDLVERIVESESANNVDSTKEAIRKFKKLGYKEGHPDITTEEMYTVLLSTASQVSFLVEERKKDMKYSGEQVSESIRAHTRRSEAALQTMRDFEHETEL